MAVKIGGKVLGAKPEPQKAAEAKAKPKKSPRGRRITNRSYPLAVYERLFGYIANGEDLSSACSKHQGMPTPSTVRRRLAVDDQLNDQYLAAQKIRLHGLADQLASLPDEAIKGYEKVSAADRLTASKQKGDNIKWLLQRGLAEYAMAGEEGQAVTLNIIGAPDLAPAAGAAPYVPAGQPVLKIVGGAAASDDSGAAKNG
ncbi:terminase small subunit-like protein [Paraburkholderia bryophila]|uniref:Terminase small subunit n=1 Tax=Paraburkholderia bryophila TaxID=420952 RepID=A0A7Z0AYP0_9BURK|nr:hypothetical protein [Paraburkholderia bryophila]NYH13552.1 hypothetical protein [Paraburkholderia bryophila]